MNTWIRHSGWYPDLVIRLFDQRKAKISDKALHEGVLVEHSTRIAYLREHVLHFSYRSLKQYFGKMNQYGESGARDMLYAGKRVNGFTLVARPIYKFVKHYFIRRGFLDGVPGLIVCVGSAFSTFIKYANLYYLQKVGRVDVSGK